MGAALWQIRNLVFEMNIDGSNYVYGTYFERKGYKIDEANFDEAALLAKLTKYGYKPTVYEGAE